MAADLATLTADLATVTADLATLRADLATLATLNVIPSTGSHHLPIGSNRSNRSHRLNNGTRSRRVIPGEPF